MKDLIRWLTIVVLLAVVAGCAGTVRNIKEKMQSMQGPTFATHGIQEEMIEGGGGEEPPPRHTSPIVRIIKGTPVENMDAARAKMVQEASVALVGLQAKLDSLILRDVNVRVIAELLTEICGYNVVATNTVAGRPIDIYLQNISLREALEAVCRLNNLWYREGQGIITLMTRDEYVRDIQVRQSEQTRAFYARYTNAADMAKVIQAAMGEEVHLEVIEDEEIYGHIDPEEEAEVGDGEYDAPVLGGGTVESSVAAGRAGAGPAAIGRAGFDSPEAARTAEGKRPLLAILTVFKRNNCIVARSLDGALLNEMARIIEALDTPTSQVLLEIKILQLTLDDGFESFFDFDYTDSGSMGLTGDFVTELGLGGSTAIGSQTFDFIFDSEKLNARLAYFENEGRAEIIATPFLMSANNSKVEFFVGEETPLRDDVTSSTTSVGDLGDTMTTYDYNIIREELGTDVEMTTFINEDATVTLEFEAEITSPILNYSTIPVVNQQTGETIEFPLDATTKSELKSILSAKSGQSIAIGGIIKETLDLLENKVPVLGDIPGLGFFFREIDNAKKKTETVIILTPHVIMHPALAGHATEEFLRRKSSHEQITRGMENILERDLPVKP
jgi:hypothetical protein